MIDRSKPLTEQTASDLRMLIDALHSNRERYNLASRIVEARSCDLEIAEATRALAIHNRRATEAEDRRQAEERASIVDLVSRTVRDRVACVAGWDGFSPGSIDRMVADIASRVADGLPGPVVVDGAQREADLREAFLAGCEHCSTARDDIELVDDDRNTKAAAEYARSKAGG